jgi:hypothetical protein
MITSPLPPSLENIGSQATADMARLLVQAYMIGREDMRRELMVLLAPKGEKPAPPFPDTNIAVASAPIKAPPGTVKPAILRMVETSPGLLTEQIISATGFKENSVRGTLSTLLKQGKIERNGAYWVKKADASSAETEEASKGMGT